MASELDTIVQVTISQDSVSPTRQGFGTPLILTYHNVFPEMYRVYGTLAEMRADGFQTFDSAYRMARRAFDQSPTVRQVVVGRVQVAPTFSKVLSIQTAVQGRVISFDVVQPATGDVTTISYTIPAAQTLTSVATAVEALVEAVPGVDSVSSVGDITVTPTVAGRQVYFRNLVNVNITDNTADAGYDDALDLLEAEDVDWYWVTTDVSSKANIDVIAAWTLSRKKLYVVASQDSGLPAGTSTIGSDLKALANDRTVVIYSKHADEFADVAWAVAVGAQTPGAITTVYKTLRGVSPTKLTTGQINALKADNVNYYSTVAGLTGTKVGKVAAGERIDIRHGIDALEARIKEDVFALLSASPKVPFTRKGFDVIESTIDAACAYYAGDDENPGLLVRSSIRVQMPDLDTIPDSEKIARELNGVRFYADLSGAIEFVSISGTLGYA